MSVDSEVAAHLVTGLTALNTGPGPFMGLLGTFTLGKNVRVGPVEPPSQDQSVTNSVPHKCLFLMAYGGRRPLRYSGTTAEGERFPMVQVWGRSDKNKYEDGKLMMEAVVEALDAKVPPATALNFYECRVTDSEPNFVQKDDAGHMEWTVNAELPRNL